MKREIIVAAGIIGLACTCTIRAQETNLQETAVQETTTQETNLQETAVSPVTTEVESAQPIETSAVPAAKDAFRFDLSAGMTYLHGDVTETIGGKAVVDGLTYRLEDPLSELKFPLGIAAVQLDASILIHEALEIYGSGAVSVTDPEDKMEDSDWDDGVKTVYSESDCDISAWNADAGIRWWFNSRPNKKTGTTAGIAPAIGYKKQSMDWDIRNLDQWYPADPQEPHDRYAGKVMTYDFDLDMAYVGGKAYLRSRRFILTLSGGVSAWLNMQATDDHILRSKKNDVDYDGNAWFAEGEGRFYFTPALFLLGRVNYFYAKADGSQKQHYYAGENAGWRAEIDGEIETKQLSGTLGIGLEF